ncbi:MAG: YvrJ family protein [Peptococcaceae bacterium]|nr:YvrJ family protein [Peptococcaceae bacterium]
MEELLRLAANFGFPMVIAFYLLVRLEPVIRELQKSIALLTVVVARQGGVDVHEARQIVDAGEV